MSTSTGGWSSTLMRAGRADQPGPSLDRPCPLEDLGLDLRMRAVVERDRQALGLDPVPFGRGAERALDSRPRWSPATPRRWDGRRVRHRVGPSSPYSPKIVTRSGIHLLQELERSSRDDRHLADMVGRDVRARRSHPSTGAAASGFVTIADSVPSKSDTTRASVGRSRKGTSSDVRSTGDSARRSWQA